MLLTPREQIQLHTCRLLHDDEDKLHSMDYTHLLSPPAAAAADRDIDRRADIRRRGQSHYAARLAGWLNYNLHNAALWVTLA